MTKHIERLTRHEADIVVRQLTDRYYEDYGYGVSSFHTEELFAEFSKNLAAIIGGEDNEDFRDYLESIVYIASELDNDYFTRRPDNAQRNYWTEQRDEAISKALDAAKVARVAA